MMNDIGRLCMKIAGRDSNKLCVIVEAYDDNTVLIDGQTRRRKCNMRHLEPLQKIVEIKKGVSHADVKKALSALKIEVLETKPKKVEPRPKKAKVNKQGTVEKKVSKKEKAPVKKAEKATVKKTEKPKSEDKKASKEE